MIMVLFGPLLVSCPLGYSLILWMARSRDGGRSRPSWDRSWTLWRTWYGNFALLRAADAADPCLSVLDLLRSRTGRMRIRSRSPHPRRPSSVSVLRPLRSDAVGPIQRYRRCPSQG
jgi:hypothetical protein